MSLLIVHHHSMPTVIFHLLLLTIFVGLPWWETSEAVRIRKYSPLESNTPVKGGLYCVDVVEEEAFCTHDPKLVLDDELTNMQYMHMGVTQRIDGTEEEKKKIEEVIRLMNAYFYDEVLSNLAFERVRTQWYDPWHAVFQLFNFLTLLSARTKTSSVPFGKCSEHHWWYRFSNC